MCTVAVNCVCMCQNFRCAPGWEHKRKSDLLHESCQTWKSFIWVCEIHPTYLVCWMHCFFSTTGHFCLHRGSPRKVCCIVLGQVKYVYVTWGCLNFRVCSKWINSVCSYTLRTIAFAHMYGERCLLSLWKTIIPNYRRGGLYILRHEHLLKKKKHQLKASAFC